MKRLLICLFIMGCSPTTLPSQPSQTPQDSSSTVSKVNTCNADKLAAFVGQPVSALETTLLLQPVRILRPFMNRTMDYRPDRLNVDVDDNDIIKRIWCG